MLKDVPYGTHYAFMPAKEPTLQIDIGDARPCGFPVEGKTPITFSQLIMNEMGRILEEKDILGWAGITGGRMMAVVALEKEEIYELLDGALMALDEVFKKNPHLMPEGGFGFEVRDWGDIPEDEKGNK